MPTSFDHLVSAQQDRWGYGKTKRLGGLEVQDHLEFCRQLNWQLRRLGAAQNAIDVGGGTTKDGITKKGRYAVVMRVLTCRHTKGVIALRKHW